MSERCSASRLGATTLWLNPMRRSHCDPPEVFGNREYEDGDLRDLELDGCGRLLPDAAGRPI